MVDILFALTQRVIVKAIMIHVLIVVLIMVIAMMVFVNVQLVG